MNSSNDFYVFAKWLEAPSGAFGIKEVPAAVPDEDKEAYWRIYSELVDTSGKAIVGFDRLILRPKNYSRERGSRGHRPVDLYVSICDQDADALGYMPQVYAIASDRGLEVGFAASIPEADYFDVEAKMRNRSLVPLINARLPSPTSQIVEDLDKLLQQDGNWTFNTGTRTSPGHPGYKAFDSLSSMLASLKENGARTGGGCIARIYPPEVLDTVNLQSEFALALARFSPLLDLARPSLWDAKVIEAQHSVASLAAAEEPFDPDSIEDGRKMVFAQVARRQGQAKFRNALLKVYDGACAITGCDISDVLQAAHILPYLGPATNHPSNGILLRADVHTLFDLGLVRVHPETLEIVVSPVLEKTSYKDYHGQILRAPSGKSSHPHAIALQKRWDLMATDGM